MPIANRIYNRLAWNAASADYVAFAEEAITASDGAFLDAGCGTATFTAAAYPGTSRPLVLVDRSLDMLSRTANRLANTPVALVQADLLDLPFSPRRFATVAFGTSLTGLAPAGDDELMLDQLLR